jgi:hypothetical protein
MVSSHVSRRDRGIIGLCSYGNVDAPERQDRLASLQSQFNDWRHQRMGKIQAHGKNTPR